MSLPLEMGPGLGAVLLLVARVTLLLGGALALAWVLRDAEPAARHRLWTGALLLALALPALPRLLPEFTLPGVTLRTLALGDATEGPGLPPEPSHPSYASGERPDGAAFPTLAEGAPGGWQPQGRDPAPAPTHGAPAGPNRTLTLVLALWGAGTAVSLAGLGLGLGRGRRLVERAAPIPTGPRVPSPGPLARRAGISRRNPVRVRVSPEVAVPLAGGLLRPCVLLPPVALTWPRERLEAVLLHEFVHLAHHDPARLLLSRLVVALYWFHPLAWAAHARAAEAREVACDARVVALLGSPSSYARHLLAVSENQVAPRALLPSPAGFTGLHPSNLERRVMAILDPVPPTSGRRSRSFIGLAGGLGWGLAVAACAPALVQEAPAPPNAPVDAPSVEAPAGPSLPEVPHPPTEPPAAGVEPLPAPASAAPPSPPGASTAPPPPPHPAGAPEASVPPEPTQDGRLSEADRLLLQAERHRLEDELVRIEELGLRLVDHQERLEATGPRLEGAVTRLEAEPQRLQEATRRLQGEVTRIRERAESEGWDEGSRSRLRDHERTLVLLEERRAELALGTELNGVRKALEEHTLTLDARSRQLAEELAAHEAETLRGHHIEAIRLRLSEIEALLQGPGGTP